MAIDDDGTYTATERRGATAESLRRSCRERSPRHITKLVGPVAFARAPRRAKPSPTFGGGQGSVRHRRV